MFRIITDLEQKKIERGAFNKGYIEAMNFAINEIQIDKLVGYDKDTEDKIRAVLNAINVSFVRKMNEHKTIENL